MKTMTLTPCPQRCGVADAQVECGSRRTSSAGSKDWPFEPILRRAAALLGESQEIRAEYSVFF